MKWIKGMWDKTTDVIFVNPQYITVVDTGRKLFWAQDCDVGVRYEDDQLPALLKLMSLTEEEAKDEQKDTKPADKGAKK